MRIPRFALAAGLALAGSQAFAQTPAAPAAVVTKSADEQFAAADRNRDGRVDREELLAALNPDAKPFVDAVWRDRDKNRDGWISKDELTDNTPPNQTVRQRAFPGAQ